MVSWLLCLCGLVYGCASLIVFFFKQKTAYEMRISDWSSDVCSAERRQPLRQCARAGGDEEAREGVEAVMSRPDSRDDRQAPAGRGTGRPTERGLRSGDYRGARDRKRVGEGKGVSVSVEQGGSSTMTKKTYRNAGIKLNTKK